MFHLGTLFHRQILPDLFFRVSEFSNEEDSEAGRVKILWIIQEDWRDGGNWSVGLGSELISPQGFGRVLSRLGLNLVTSFMFPAKWSFKNQGEIKTQISKA